MFKSYNLSTGETLSISLLSGIICTSELKKKILDQTIKCCCITTSLVLDAFQIAVAADKACLARSRGKMVTRNINAEILYYLSISKHISRSLMMFGIQENASNVVVAVIGSEEDLQTELAKINGNQISLEILKALVDKNAVNKEYNITDEELKTSSQLDSVITRITTKNL